MIQLDDPQLDQLIAKAAITAARLRSHDRFCAACSALEYPSHSPCTRRRQLDRLLQGRRALVNARRKTLGRR